jgi:hypothetical protein
MEWCFEKEAKALPLGRARNAGARKQDAALRSDIS